MYPLVLNTEEIDSLRTMIRLVVADRLQKAATIAIEQSHDPHRLAMAAMRIAENYRELDVPLFLGAVELLRRKEHSTVVNVQPPIFATLKTLLGFTYDGPAEAQTLIMRVRDCLPALRGAFEAAEESFSANVAPNMVACRSRN